MQFQGHISVPERADKFFSDHLGRKILVMGPSRKTAADSMKAFLEDLTGVEPTAESAWRYVDPRGNLRGPFGHSKMLAWCHKGYFAQTMSVLYENPVIRVWVPVWLLEFLEHSVRHGTIETMEWEATVQDVTELRTSYVETSKVCGTSSGNGGELGVAPMDYDIVDIAWEDGAVRHVVAVLDTNVLLSHFSFLERVFQEILSSSSSDVELMVIIPWVVLSELDHLKEGRNREAAMYAIKRINALNSQRDSFVFIQSSKSHAIAVETISLPDQQHSLRNDDFIMQTCMYFEQSIVDKMRQKGHKSCLILVSNDQGLQMRAAANGLNCIKAVELGTNGKKLVEKIAQMEGDGTGAEDGAVKRDHKDEDERRRDVEEVCSSVVVDAHTPAAVQVESVQARPPMSTHDIHMLVTDAISHGLGTVVMYFRQQDLGDMWEELLEDELKPPWDASQVLKVMIRHSTTFWSIFDRNLTHDAKVLLRYMRPGIFEAHFEECLLIVMRLLHASHAAFSKPFDGEAPDPATVPNFVSLGEAKKAVQDSIASLSRG